MRQPTTLMRHLVALPDGELERLVRSSRLDASGAVSLFDIVELLGSPDALRARIETIPRSRLEGWPDAAEARRALAAECLLVDDVPLEGVDELVRGALAAGRETAAPHRSADRTEGAAPRRCADPAEDATTPTASELERRARQAVERAVRQTLIAAELWSVVASSPVRELTRGGASIAFLRGRAEQLSLEEADVVDAFEALTIARFITPRDGIWHPTTTGAAWRASHLARRTAALIAAWWTSLETGVRMALHAAGGRAAQWIAAELPLAAPRLLPLAHAARASAERLGVIDATGSLTAVGTELTSPDRGSDNPEGSERGSDDPGGGLPGGSGRLARLSGVEPTLTAPDLATPAPRDEHDPVTRLERVLDGRTPAEIDGFYVQNDRSIIAPGPLEAKTEEQLRRVATLESLGLASTYRVSPESIEAAVGQGLARERIHAFFAEHSLTGVPQALRYAIDDAGRRRGAIVEPAPASRRGGAAGQGSRISFGDAASAAAAAGDRRLRALRLQAGEAPRGEDATEYTSTMTSSLSVLTLRQAGYEAELAGSARLDAPAVVDPPEDAEDDLAERLSALRDAQAWRTDDDLEAGWLERRIQRAIERRIVLRMVIAVASDREAEFEMVPTGLGGGRVRARDSRSAVERTVPLSAVREIEELEPFEAEGRRG